MWEATLFVIICYGRPETGICAAHLHSSPAREKDASSSTLDTHKEARKGAAAAPELPGSPHSGHNRPSMGGKGADGQEVKLAGEPGHCPQGGSRILLWLTLIIRSPMETCLQGTSKEETQ